MAQSKVHISSLNVVEPQQTALACVGKHYHGSKNVVMEPCAFDKDKVVSFSESNLCSVSTREQAKSNPLYGKKHRLITQMNNIYRKINTHRKQKHNCKNE